MFPLSPQKNVRPRLIALHVAGVRRWGNHQGRPFKRRRDASALRPKSNVRRPGKRIILAYVLTGWLVTIDPVGRGVLQQRFGENVVPVAAQNDGTPGKTW